MVATATSTRLDLQTLLTAVAHAAETRAESPIPPPGTVVLAEAAPLWLLVDSLRDYAEQVALPVGTVRSWGDAAVKKVAPGKWVTVPKSDRPTKALKPGSVQPTTAKPAVTKGPAAPGPDPFVDPHGALAQQIARGERAGTYEEHRKITEDFLNRHKASLPAALERLRGLAPEGAVVQGRVKDVDSSLGKLVRKPRYKDATALQDGTGMRVILNSVDDVMDTVAKIKKRYKVVTEDNYITEPAPGDYRSYHVIIEDEDGLQKEVQVRTQNEHTYAEWSHKLYKPHTPEETAAVQEHADEIFGYSAGMSDYFLSKDLGDEAPEPPPCPLIVKQVFGCIS